MNIAVDSLRQDIGKTEDAIAGFVHERPGREVPSLTHVNAGAAVAGPDAEP